MAEEATNEGALNGCPKVVTYCSLKPQVFVDAGKADDAVKFYKRAFGAVEVNRVSHPKRKADQELPLVISAELSLGGSSIIVSELTQNGAPAQIAGSGYVLCLQTEQVDAAVAQTVRAGAVSVPELSEAEVTCCEGHMGKVRDPYGIVWLICSVVNKRAEEDEKALDPVDAIHI